MKKFRKMLLVFFVLILGLNACDDSDSSTSYVYGSMAVGSGSENQDDNIDGKLVNAKGSDYFGFCKYDGEKFSFTVANAPLSELNLVRNLYVNVTGITGANAGKPVEGVFNEHGIPRGGIELQSTFTQAHVASYSTDSFIFTPASGCAVNLFAVPSEGEFIPGTSKEFEYYVEINCGNLQNVRGSSNLNFQLSSFSVKLFFDKCK